MSDWKLSMLLLLPLMWGSGKGRTWGAMFGSSLLAGLSANPVFYFFLDGVAGALVRRRPEALPQRAIGYLFASMMLFDAGYALSDQKQQILYLSFLSWLGWAQYGILLVWGLHDAWKYIVRRSGYGGDLAASQRATG